MLSKDLAKQRVALIDLDKASCKVLPSEIRDTLEADGKENAQITAWACSC
jgi:gamma-glutamyltranspeptidase/glutathione hydrolase